MLLQYHHRHLMVPLLVLVAVLLLSTAQSKSILLRESSSDYYGGTENMPTRPWLVLLRVSGLGCASRDNEDNSYQSKGVRECTGALISSRYVVTAASCLYESVADGCDSIVYWKRRMRSDQLAYLPVSPNRISVLLGELDYSHGSWSSTKTREVSDWVAHEHYRPDMPSFSLPYAGGNSGAKPQAAGTPSVMTSTMTMGFYLQNQPLVHIMNYNNFPNTSSHYLNDIAIVKLSRSIDFASTSLVSPIALPFKAGAKAMLNPQVALHYVPSSSALCSPSLDNSYTLAGYAHRIVEQKPRKFSRHMHPKAKFVGEKLVKFTGCVPTIFSPGSALNYGAMSDNRATVTVDGSGRGELCWAPRFPRTIGAKAGTGSTVHGVDLNEDPYLVAIGTSSLESNAGNDYGYFNNYAFDNYIPIAPYCDFIASATCGQVSCRG